MRVLVLNAGSTTVKAALVEGRAGRFAVRAERTVEVRRGADHHALFHRALEPVLDGGETRPPDAVGHRVVHGGTTFTDPVVVDEEVEREIERLEPLAPLHDPPALEGIRAARETFPDVPNVAVFDTAFHSRRAPESARHALPWELEDELRLHRYGFHGIAHAALVEELARAEGGPVEDVWAVTLQLGGGASACAVAGGRSVETSMGLTPLTGLVMATRPGDVDPTVVLELLRNGRTVQDVERVLHSESGLRGLAGSADMRDVLRAEAAGDPRARTAVAMVVRRIVATTGAYLTLLGGRGAVVFGGGVGRHSAVIRARVAEGLAPWGVALDRERNEAGEEGRISAEGSRGVHVFETREEPLIAREVEALLAGTARERPGVGPKGPTP